MKNKLKKILFLNKTTTLLLHLCVISKRSLSILLATWSDLDGKLVVVVVEVVVVIIIFLQQSTVLPCAMRYTKTRERDFFPRKAPRAVFLSPAAVAHWPRLPIFHANIYSSDCYDFTLLFPLLLLCCCFASAFPLFQAGGCGMLVWLQSSDSDTVG